MHRIVYCTASMVLLMVMVYPDAAQAPHRLCTYGAQGTDGEYSTLKSRTPAKEATNADLTYRDSYNHEKTLSALLLHSHPEDYLQVLSSRKHGV